MIPGANIFSGNAIVANVVRAGGSEPLERDLEGEDP